ncbi:hypothetical protein Pme01_41660 [Planosporangium mesophilum]|uniref:Uncharacterized protein n=2 Tax=Planosporangium mesophilum TaxID=689768 RepID=A0A8J3TH15_9ACTN|nr:hypothetical protein [Planosporangium mesophilum]GII24569.1 hypothetical protein Pme01_41660 [Planosporangium mesophilum]
MVLAVAVTAGVLLFLDRVGKHLTLRLPNSRACVVDSGGSGEILLDADQMANAATVAAVGLSRQVPQRAITVALATVWQESKLRNLSGGDRDSIGLFQQRPSQGWGTPAQISDPRYASRTFYDELLKVDGWETMRVTDAAQAVQRSAHPEAYEKWADRAEGLAKALTGDAAGAVACTVTGEPVKRGPTATDALAAELRLDWGNRTNPVTAGDLPGLALPVTESRAGWQYAHWLVAYARDLGVKRVRFTDREWTAKGGSWSKITADPSDGARVLAEVYGSP